MWFFRRRGLSGFSSSSTAEEVTEGIDGNGLTAIVTGASSGIGIETARVLAKRGAHVIMAVRKVGAGHEVRNGITKEFPAAKVDVMELDLSSMASVRRFSSQFNSSGLPLNILINNAGIMATPYKLSEDGIELQFATNHMGMLLFRMSALFNFSSSFVCDLGLFDSLFRDRMCSCDFCSGRVVKVFINTSSIYVSGHFLLTNSLLDIMNRTAKQCQKEGKIVNVSSEFHRFTYREAIRFDKINDQMGYNSFLAYGQSKLSNILHANELARRLKQEEMEICVNSLHPGAISTNLFRHSTIIDGIVSAVGKLLLKNVQQGAATTCYVALNPQVKGMSGCYFVDSNLHVTSRHAGDEELAKRLWEYSMRVTGVYEDRVF